MWHNDLVMESKHIVRLCAAILILTAVDQSVKLLISRFFFYMSVELVPGILAFRPVQNTDLSWVGSLGFRLFANFYVTVIVNLVILFVTVVLFRYLYTAKNTRGKFTQTCFILLVSGAVCSTIDRIFWKGSIDYICLEGFFTFDLKDCYISAFIVLFLFCGFKFKNEWKEFRIFEFIRNPF